MDGYGVDYRTPDLLNAVEALEHFKGYDKPVEALPTGFPMWDEACGGFGGRVGIAMGWYCVVAGDTGQGKSLLALQLGCQALRHGYAPGFVSLEMAMHELRNRFFSQMFGVEAKALEPGKWFQKETADKVVQAIDRYREKHGRTPFNAADEVDPKLPSILALMDAWRDEGTNVFLVDYLQLCEAPDAVGIAQETLKISKAMRDYAHRHRVIVIALAQYNNEGGNDRSRPPHVGHIYGGRRVSQDSDMTVMLDHSRWEQDDLYPHIARTWMMLPKNRHGPKGLEIPIQWDYRYLTAREATPDEVSLWPESGR